MCRQQMFSPESEFSFEILFHFTFLWISSAWRWGFSSSQWPSHGADQRIEYGTAEKQQRLTAVLQWLQHRDHNPILLWGHNSFTRWSSNLLLPTALSALAFNCVHHSFTFLLATCILLYLVNLQESQPVKGRRYDFLKTKNQYLHTLQNNL